MVVKHHKEVTFRFWEKSFACSVGKAREDNAGSVGISVPVIGSLSFFATFFSRVFLRGTH